MKISEISYINRNERYCTLQEFEAQMELSLKKYLNAKCVFYITQGWRFVIEPNLDKLHVSLRNTKLDFSM